MEYKKCAKQKLAAYRSVYQTSSDEDTSSVQNSLSGTGDENSSDENKACVKTIPLGKQICM